MKAKYVALCPACSARLPMDASHMEIADGNIRCGKCNTAFYAPDHLLRGFYSPEHTQKKASLIKDTENLIFDLAEADEQQVSAPVEKNIPEPYQPQPEVDRQSAASMQDEHPIEQPSSHFDEDPTQKIKYDQVVHAKGRPKARKRRKTKIDRDKFTTEKKSLMWLWIPAICVALIALLFQVLVINVSSWSHNPLLRGIYGQICATSLCQLPVNLKPVSLNIEIAGYRLLDNGTYEIKGLLTNWAYYSQPFPVIEVSFVDVTENEHFSKAYTPEEYIFGLDKPTALASEQQFDFMLLVTDLSKESRRYFPRLKLVSY